ncbi:YIEGIA family protein [Brevibacillus choshinensis]|uniref:YIEGIA family protein n=1 Tax=Brevibacillus choshinensis TaxID=54911 RepID=A0ABX7FWL8_BRECH|nr:YIEGIA family protein [Brevibacillus choshinensis]QRG69892.1 YIEGIA family protein [Brevibacillus choshinensis]
MFKVLLANEYVFPLMLGFIFGILCRINLLRTDYRQYPTYPHGKIIHISLGVIASALGALAIPALLKENYTAVTFLTVAAQQFRDVRNMERTTLNEIDKQELVPRGGPYIEGIAMVFEGRNYLVMFTSLVTTTSMIFFHWWGGIIAGLIALTLSAKLKSGKTLKLIVDVKPAPVRVEGKDLYVGDIYIMNVGLEESQKVIREQGMGYILVPKDANATVTIAHPGQRQAILHDVATQLGVFTDTGEPSLTPLVKRDLHTGRLGVFLLPQVKDQERALSVISAVPILESVFRMPQKTQTAKQEV